MRLTTHPEYLIWPVIEHGIHHRLGTEHFLIVGASGSGKTTLINMLMKSVFASKCSLRAMVYDPKQEILPYLYGMVSNDVARVKILHPLDQRCCAWNLARDIDGPVSARQLATILIPDEQSGNSASFFTNAVRDLLTGVLLAFIKCVPVAGQWTFRDVLLTMLYEPYLRFMLNLDRTREGQPFPQVARLRQSYLEGDSRTVSNVRATINSKLSIYEPIAAVWHSAKQTFSLAEWATEGCQQVLVLGNDEAARAAIDAVNQAIFKRATELMLANRESTRAEKASGENQTWFFLDEVREAGYLDGLSRLLTKGRSKGACIVLGFQDIDGMREAYGDEVAHEICGQCNNVAILRLNSPSTAEWASALFGRFLSQSSGASRDVSGGDRTIQEGEEERPWLYTSDFLYLPKTDEENGLTAYFRGPGLDPAACENGIDDLKAQLEWEEIEALRPQPHPETEALERQDNFCYSAKDVSPPEQHYLKPWDEEDWKRLGFDGKLTDLFSNRQDAAAMGAQPRLPKTIRTGP